MSATYTRTRATKKKLKTLQGGESALAESIAPASRKEREEFSALKEIEQHPTEAGLEHVVKGLIEKHAAQPNPLEKATSEIPGVHQIEQAGEAAESTAKFLGKLTEVKTWERIGKILIGVAIVFFGLFLFAKAIGAKVPKGKR